MAGGDEKTTTFNVLVSGINKQGVDVNLNGKSVAFTLKNIGYRDAKGKFKVVKKGKWKLDWTFKTEADVTTKEVNKNISLLDAKATWKDIRISPLSVTVDFQITKSGKAHMSFKEWNKLEKTQRVVVQFADGTREDSRFCDDVNEEWGDEKTSGYRRIGFRKVIEPKDIVSVTFGDQTVVLNPNVKLEQRTKLRSKAANCTVALPQNVAKLITVKEKIGENAFANCKKLTKVTIPKSVDIIDQDAFSKCKNLKKITFKGTPSDISPYAFDGTAVVSEPGSIKTQYTWAVLDRLKSTRKKSVFNGTF